MKEEMVAVTVSVATPTKVIGVWWLLFDLLMGERRGGYREKDKEGNFKLGYWLELEENVLYEIAFVVVYMVNYKWFFLGKKRIKNVHLKK